VTISHSGATLLAIETAGSNCSAAVVRAGSAPVVMRQPLRHGHAEALLPMIERAMAEAGLTAAHLDAVAVAVGPGGFTGIRVGLAAAHGIALASGARIVGVSSFEAVAAAMAAGGDADSRALLIALDSRRTDLYVQLFGPDQATAIAPPAAVLPERLAEHVATIIGRAPLLIAGDAAGAAAAALGMPDGPAVAQLAPDALGVAAAARRQLRSDIPAAPARPFYLRQADVTLPKKRQSAVIGRP
jgi:tRNA threonylcarbamoyladenosine biosynthesis protein TsaB